MSDKILDKINKLQAKTERNEIIWKQENLQTYYISQKDKDFAEIQISIQFLPPIPGTILSLASLFTNVARFLFQIKNISTGEILFKIQVLKGEDRFDEVNNLYVTIKHKLDEKANNAKEEEWK